jgi:hypothetical protein
MGVKLQGRLVIDVGVPGRPAAEANDGRAFLSRKQLIATHECAFSIGNSVVTRSSTASPYERAECSLHLDISTLERLFSPTRDVNHPDFEAAPHSKQTPRWDTEQQQLLLQRCSLAQWSQDTNITQTRYQMDMPYHPILLTRYYGPTS